mgnify:CR=1 FL=1
MVTAIAVAAGLTLLAWQVQRTGTDNIARGIMAVGWWGAAGMGALDPVRLILADVEPPLRDRLLVGRPVVGAIEPWVPALQAGEQPLQRGPVTTAAFPVNQSA